MPKASVVISAFNAEKYIAQTLDSVLNQTLSDFECIIVDDGSTDGTFDIIKKYSDSRIKYYFQKNSGGPASPRNTGIKFASGEYIFIFDADDVMLPQKLEKAVSVLEKDDRADLLFSNFQSIDEVGAVIQENYLALYSSLWELLGGDAYPVSYIPSEKLFPALLRVNFIATSSVVLRRLALDGSDKFNETLRNSDDRLFWLTFAKGHQFVFLNEVCHQYRIQKNGISNQAFERRAPSKIKALKLAKKLCSNGVEHKVINAQIINDYHGLVYSYGKSKKYLKAGCCVLSSFFYGINRETYVFLKKIIAKFFSVE